MRGRTFNVSILIGAKNLAGGAIRAASRGFRGFRGIVLSAGGALLGFGVNIVRNTIRRIQSLVKWIAILGTAMAEEVGRRSINAFADYEQSITNAMSISGLFGEELEKGTKSLFDFGLALAEQSNKMATDIAQGFYMLMSAGLSLTQTMQAAPAVLALAEGTLADLGLTTELATGAMKAFELPATAMTRIVNTLAAGTNWTRLTMERLAEGLKYAGTYGKEFGVSLEGTVAALGMVVDRGIDASSAGTQFRMMLAKSSDVASKGAAVLRQYGLSVADISIEQRGFVPVLRTLHRAQMSYSDLIQIFGLRATAIAGILVKNVDAYVALTKKITGTNAAFRMQSQQLDTLKGQWQAFKGDVQKVAVEFVKGMAPVLRIIIDRLRSMAQWLSRTGAAEEFGRRIGVLIKQVYDVADAFVHGRETGVAWLDEFWQARGVPGFIADVREGVTGLIDWLEGTEDFPKVWAKAFADAFIGEIGKMVGIVIGYLDDLLSRTFEGWDAMKASARTVINAWGEVAVEMADAIKAILPHVVSLVKWLADITEKHPKLMLYVGLFGLFFDKIITLGRAVWWLGGRLKWLATLGIPSALKWLGGIFGIGAGGRAAAKAAEAAAIFTPSGVAQAPTGRRALQAAAPFAGPLAMGAGVVYGAGREVARGIQPSWEQRGMFAPRPRWQEMTVGELARHLVDKARGVPSVTVNLDARGATIGVDNLQEEIQRGVNTAMGAVR